MDSDSEFEYFSASGSGLNANRKRRETMYFDCLDYTPKSTPVKNLNFSQQGIMEEEAPEAVIMKESVKSPAPSAIVIGNYDVHKISFKSRIPKLVRENASSSSKPNPNNKLSTPTSSASIPLQNKTQTRHRPKNDQAGNLRKVEDNNSMGPATSTPKGQVKKQLHFCCK